jgi:hypothetical protein
MVTSAERIVRARLHWGKDFPTEKALREYLKSHPDADPKNHRVDETAKKGPRPEETGKPRRPGLPKPPAPAGPKAKPPEAPKPAKPKPPPIPEAAKKKPQEAPKPEAKAPTAPAAKPAQPAAPTAPQAPAAPAAKPSRTEAWKSRFKGLSQAATSFVEKAPKAVQHFFGNDEYRKSSLNAAKDALTKAPKKLMHNLVETAKDEVHEFKTASAGVKQLMSGKDMTKKQKHAFTAVATHMAIGATAAAFAASGPLMAAGLFAKGLAQHVALKSVNKSLSKLHLFQELGHIGHGVAHLLSHVAAEDKDGKRSPDDAMAEYILACVASEIDALTDEDFQTVLNAMKEGEEKTAAERVVERYLTQP